jgi:hypothetical protein
MTTNAMSCAGLSGFALSKQFYHYIVEDWLNGDPDMAPPECRKQESHLYGDDLRVECPPGSGKFMNLGKVSQELASPLRIIFLSG